MNPTGLTVTELSAAYGPVKALDQVSFEVAAGSITAVLGANGAGKTTLLRTMTGLLAATHGSVLVDGADLTKLAPEEVVRHGVAHVPEGRGVIQQLTVEENLRLGALWRRERDDRDAALEEVYDLFPPLRTRRSQSALALSGGERQMLAIGRGLMARPRVLLLDEPSLGLAPIVVAGLLALLQRLSESGLSVLLVEQNARSALSIASWALVLNLGQVVRSDRAEVIAADEALRHHYLGF